MEKASFPHASSLRLTTSLSEWMKADKSAANTRLNAEPEVPSNIPPNIYPNVQPDVSQNIEPNADPNVQLNVSPNIQPNIQPNADFNVESDVPKNIEPNIHSNVESEVLKNIEPNAHPDVPSNIFPNTLPKERLAELHRARLFEYDELSSTQTVLGEHAYESFFAGDVLSARVQREGRGRGFHKWSSSPGTSLTFSLLLTVLSARETIFYPQLAAIATARALEALSAKITPKKRFSCTLKWPNDVFVNGKKIAGVLIDQFTKTGHPTSLIVGVGINVLDTREILSRYVGKTSKYEATSFFCETGERCPLTEPLRYWLDEFFRLEALWLCDEVESIRREWHDRSHFLGTFVRWTSRETEQEDLWGSWRVSALTPKGEIVLTRMEKPSSQDSLGYSAAEKAPHRKATPRKDHKRQGSGAYIIVPLEELPMNIGEI